MDDHFKYPEASRPIAPAPLGFGSLCDTVKPITVTVPVALHITGLGRTKLYELIDAGVIKAVRIGRRRLVVHASLEALAMGNAA
jgi:excisionase family DNA binding protein